jgi:hypothetical protein
MVVACAERIRQEPDGLELETILAVFASYVLDINLIKQLLRWEMTIFKESPLIQELYTLAFEEGEQTGLKKGEQTGLKKGRQEGEQTGLKKGRQQGKRQAILKDLRQILTIRFEAPPPDFERRLDPLGLPALEQLITVALTLPTWAEFEQSVVGALASHGKSKGPGRP